MLTQQPPTGGSLGMGSFSPSFGEHLNFLPPADQGAMMGTMGSQVIGETVVVSQALEGGRLGLKVTDDTLEVTGFYDERAQGYGFRVGDRILKVNGVSVSEQQDFLQEVARALELNRTRGQPLAFTVVHQGPPGAALGAGLEQPPAPPRTAPPAEPHEAPPARGMARDVSVASVYPPAPPAPGRGQRAVEDPPPAPRAPSSSSRALAKSAAMLGSWVYSDEDGPDYNYQISREASGLLLRFSQRVPSTGLVSGTLSPVDDGWYEGTLSLPTGMRHGTLRLCYDADRDEMISYLMMKGASSWGEQVRSHRLQAPASLSSPAPPPQPAAGGRHPQAGAPLALPFASVPGSPASLQAYDHGTPPSQGVLTLPDTHS